MFVEIIWISISQNDSALWRDVHLRMQRPNIVSYILTMSDIEECRHCNSCFACMIRYINLLHRVPVLSGKLLKVPKFSPSNFKAMESPGGSLWSLNILEMTWCHYVKYWNNDLFRISHLSVNISACILLILQSLTIHSHPCMVCIHT